MCRTATSNENLKRLKERFRDGSLADFSAREVFELLLSFAMPGRDPNPLARALVERYGGLAGVFEAGGMGLEAVEGLGEDASILMELVKGVACTYREEESPARKVIRTKLDVLRHVSRSLAGRPAERFIAIYLNSRNEVLDTKVLHEGPVDRRTVPPRRAIEEAFRLNGHGVIFVHRHPRRLSTPTEAEKVFIRTLWSAASAVDLIVHDHLIMSRLDLYSAVEGGLISNGPPLSTPSLLSKAASP
ncbi:MAG: JAB domain-containing protein [Thermodesulfobacteriota bacterium]